MNPRTLLAGAVLALCATATPATDLLQVWQAARQHDPQGAVSEAGRAAGATRREQAAALWRPNLGLSASAGWANGQSQTNGAQFSALNSGLSDQANFSTSINGGTATRRALNARQPLYSPERRAQAAQLQVAAQASEHEWQLSQQDWMLQTTQRYMDVVQAERRLALVLQQQQAVNTTINLPLDMKVVMYWQSSAPPSMRARQGSLIEILLPTAFSIFSFPMCGSLQLLLPLWMRI